MSDIEPKILQKIEEVLEEAGHHLGVRTQIPTYPGLSGQFCARSLCYLDPQKDGNTFNRGDAQGHVDTLNGILREAGIFDAHFIARNTEYAHLDPETAAQREQADKSSFLGRVIRFLKQGDEDPETVFIDLVPGPQILAHDLQI